MEFLDGIISKIIFNQLIGVWNLERQITGCLGQGFLSGQSIFTKIDDTRLKCFETGQLILNGIQNEVNRTYIYEYHDDKIIVYYDDPHRKGDILHELHFIKQADDYIANHCHICGYDSYDLSFTASADGNIKMTYAVKGPHKNYRMESQLTRSIF